MMHLPSLPSFLLTLSLSLNLNLDFTQASPVSTTSCSTLSAVSFLAPRTMSVLGIRQECIDNAQRAQLNSRYVFRRTLDYITPTSYVGEPNSDEGELYGREVHNKRRPEGMPHNPTVLRAEAERTQEPFEVFVSAIKEKLAAVEDYQDDARVAGLSISQPFTRPRTPCPHTELPVAAPRRSFARLCKYTLRDFQRRTYAVLAALGSIDDNLAAAAAVAIGVVIMVLLAVETALGRRRARSRSSRSGARGVASCRGRLQHSRMGSKRHFCHSLSTIPEIEAKVPFAETRTDACYDEKHAMMLSFAQ